VLLAPSQATADALVAAGAEAARVEVVEEGADHLPAGDRAAARRLLQSLGVVGEYVVTVSTLEPRKNLPRLLAAFTTARARLGESTALVVVGPAGWGPAVRPTHGAVLAGAVSDAVLAALYEGARCLVYVPLVEGFGLPAVEAMQARVPVVASAMPSTGGAALEVDPLDPDAIAEAIVVACTDDERRDALVDAGQKRAASLRWRDAARRHVEIWEHAAARDGAMRGAP
jgi:glycosyltransferase involved in cell wall biosynthesis